MPHDESERVDAHAADAPSLRLLSSHTTRRAASARRDVARAPADRRPEQDRANELYRANQRPRGRGGGRRGGAPACATGCGAFGGGFVCLWPDGGGLPSTAATSYTLKYFQQQRGAERRGAARSARRSTVRLLKMYFFLQQQLTTRPLQVVFFGGVSVTTRRVATSARSSSLHHQGASCNHLPARHTKWMCCLCSQHTCDPPSFYVVPLKRLTQPTSTPNNTKTTHKPRALSAITIPCSPRAICDDSSVFHARS